MGERRRQQTFQERLEWLKANRPEHVKNPTDWAVQAGVGKATVTSAVAIMKKRGETEPSITRPIYKALAGQARCSLRWLMGLGGDPNDTDVPDPPVVDPVDKARRKIGKAADALSRIDDLESRVKALEEKLAGFARA